MQLRIYIIFLSILMLGCSDDTTSQDEPSAEEDELLFTDISYEGNIKPIVQTNCIACHTDPPNNGASIPLTTYEAVKNAVESRDLIQKINSATNPMPPDGLMPKETRRIFDAWVTQGLKEN
ncbi:hypothetical protein [Muriicola sp. Z0-33]|uniref:hypothetical protein n=1 Tax=Muriicola sp. Z0-33 TaxID=2816957 RepID=UPI0022391498|nr:hypothetical protein [Muriicola sp. Z0-33]MCW5517072.1 hypothetical protein [Muriicola sp. Z0-33]